jgi:hypothetical protein
LKTATWTSSFYDVLFGFERLLQQLAKDSEFHSSFLVAKKTLRSKFSYLKIHRVCLMRSYGIYDFKVYIKNISFAEDISLIRLYYVISIAPNWLFFPLRSFYFVLRFIKRISYKVPDIDIGKTMR